MKKVLMNASVASMIYKFNMGNIDILESMGYQVDVACNFGKENPISQDEIKKFKEILEKKGIKAYEIDCPRSIFAIGKIVRTYQQLKEIIDGGEYDLIHTQSPIGGVVCRLAARKARKKGTKVIYTAHGFHFFKGAPIFNWMIFYPIERICSRFNDILITINKEDYQRAKTFHSKKVEYIPGVGVDVSKFKNRTVSKHEKRLELGISDDAVVLLSVGELSSGKNYQVVIRALGKVNNSNIIYIIAGKGEEYDDYLKLAIEYGVSDQLILLGVRADIDELCVAADVFVHPSVSEGLEIASLEGMAAGLPLISSYVNGIKDNENGVCIENPLDEDAFANAIRTMMNLEFRGRCGSNNIEAVNRFSMESSNEKKTLIYKEIRFLGGGYRHLLKLLKRAELGIKETDFVLLSVGEINKNKNHKVIIEALYRLKNENIHYCIAGQGGDLEQLKELTVKYDLEGNVHFLGFRNDVKELLLVADVFCFPSRREGLGLAALEAMASGLPVISSNIHGIKDYSINGKTGYAYNPDDIAGFSDAIKKLMDVKELRNTFGNKAIEVAKRFSMERSQQCMKEIYQQISGG